MEDNKNTEAKATLALMFGLTAHEFEKIVNHEVGFIVEKVNKYQPKTIYPDIIQYMLAFENYPINKQHMNERSSGMIEVTKTKKAETIIDDIIDDTLNSKRFPYLIGYKKLVKYGPEDELGYGLTIKSFDGSYEASVIIPFIDKGDDGYAADVENIMGDVKNIKIHELEYAYEQYANKMQKIAKLFNFNEDES